MRPKLPSLSVPDLARVKGDSPEKAAEWLIDHFNEPGGTFNYIRSIRSIRAGYRGLHNINQLLAACDCEKNEVGRKSNRDLVNVVAPLAFGRQTQVFDLPSRKFSFGHRLAGFRVPFFFVENGKIILYYVWPRKRLGLKTSEVEMIATIFKKYLLDTEFFGMPSDIEFIHASAPVGSNERDVCKFDFSSVDLWSETALADRLTVISRALDIAEASGEVHPKARANRAQAPDMPLFD